LAENRRKKAIFGNNSAGGKPLKVRTCAVCSFIEVCGMCYPLRLG